MLLCISLDTHPSSYTCIGARERIFDHCFFRNSAPTTLVNLDPIGSPFLLINTQALSSNLIKLPSFLCSSFRARTTTACRMSPRRTLFEMLRPPELPSPKDRCFCTTTIILSPILAACLFFRITATHSTMAAPELSIQLSIVFSCIIVAA